MRYYIKKSEDEEVGGPYSTEELNRLIAEKKIGPDCIAISDDRPIVRRFEPRTGLALDVDCRRSWSHRYVFEFGEGVQDLAAA